MWSRFLKEKNDFQEKKPESESEFDLSDLEREITMATFEEQFNNLKCMVENLTLRLNQSEPQIVVHKDLEVTVTNAKDVSLDIFKTLPEFDGDRKKYATWRSTAHTAMKLLSNHTDSMRYYEALMIVRNKIVGAASNILNNYNTPFNFEAIVDRLDFTYADKRDLYVLEQELSILQQNKSSIDDYYDQINEKLNAIVNKINMTYKDKNTANAFIDDANTKALRTFITGLSHRKGELLYAANPKTLPEAYARLQMIINDQERINYANTYNFKRREREDQKYQGKHQEFDQKYQVKHQNFRHPQFKWQPKNDQVELQNNNNDREPQNSKFMKRLEPMDIDKSSMNVNIDRAGSSKRFNTFKRDYSQQLSSQHKKKLQRINNVNADTNADAKTIVEEELEDDDSEDDEDDSKSVSSIFLDE